MQNNLSIVQRYNGSKPAGGENGGGDDKPREIAPIGREEADADSKPPLIARAVIWALLPGSAQSECFSGRSAPDRGGPKVTDSVSVVAPRSPREGGAPRARAT